MKKVSLFYERESITYLRQCTQLIVKGMKPALNASLVPLKDRILHARNLDVDPKFIFVYVPSSISLSLDFTLPFLNVPI